MTSLGVTFNVSVKTYIKLFLKKIIFPRTFMSFYFSSHGNLGHGELVQRAIHHVDSGNLHRAPDFHGSRILCYYHGHYVFKVRFFCYFVSWGERYSVPQSLSARWYTS